MNEMSAIPTTVQEEFLNNLDVRDGLTRLSAIVAPDAKMERMLFGYVPGQKIEFEQVRQIIEWFEPRLDAFLNDQVLLLRVKEMVEYYANPSYRGYVRRCLMRDQVFDLHTKRQSDVLHAAGANKALIDGVMGIQWVSRLDFQKRNRLNYPVWSEVEKMLRDIQQRVKNGREFIKANGQGTTTADIALGRDWFVVCSLAVNAVIGGEARDSMAVVLAENYHRHHRTVRIVLMDA